jgi:linoleoyl-CoA desaturase
MLLGRGRDCTELFESVHSLSKMNVHKILEKYRVDTPKEGPPPPQEIFSWKKDGFYAVLRERAKKYFDDIGSDHKANSTYWVKVTLMFFLWFGLFRYSLFNGNALAALTAGFLMNMLGFCCMHDGSHYGISKRVWVNRGLHTLWNDWNLWSHFIWLRHHVYGHHSYTGIFRRDPDLVNVSLVIRKTAELRHSKIFETQHYHTWFLLGVLPNQHLGQALLYSFSWITRSVFGVKLDRQRLTDLIVSLMIYLPSLYVHFYLPFCYLPVSRALLVIMCYWTAQGIGYYLNIIPNHDTHHTHDNNHNITSPEGSNGNEEKRDWGAQQVIGSGNHTTDGGWWSSFVAATWGGMNYQIEHHLFPSVSHVHYPALSKIVQQTCKEFSIPYVTHSWFDAFVSFTKLLKRLSSKTYSVKTKVN